MDEPFNPHNFEGRYLRSASELENVDRVLTEIWKSANGIKHVWDPSGWPFASTSHNDRLLSSGGYIVFLRRRNVLRRIVSSLISEQLHEWAFAYPEDRERLRCFTFSPLNTDVVRWHVANEIRLVDETRERFEQKANLFELWYEDLYDTNISVTARHQVFDRIRSFLSIASPGDSVVLTEIDRRLGSGIDKINSAQTYSRIPGIDKVEQEFGNDETGWLFK